MTQCQTFPSPEAIRAWAGVSNHHAVNHILWVQHSKDKLYHYFAFEGGVWVYKMNSITPLGE